MLSPILRGGYDLFYVRIRFDDKWRKHPYVVYISGKPSDKYPGWNKGLVEGHDEVVYVDDLPEGCELGGNAIKNDECVGGYKYYHARKEPEPLRATEAEMSKRKPSGFWRQPNSYCN